MGIFFVIVPILIFETALCLPVKDPSYKRIKLCDEKLKELFDVDSFHGFTINKFLAFHFVKS